MSGIPPVSLRGNVPTCAQASQSQMNANSCQVADRQPHPACEDGDQVSVLGNCPGFVVVPAGQVHDFYRGYALVAVPLIAMTAVAGIAYFVFGLSF